MSVLRFASEQSLLFTVTSGLVPESVLAGRARTWRDDEGGVVIAAAEAIAPETMKALAAAGVSRLPAKASSPDAVSVRCWAEIIRVVRGRTIDEDVGQVLFVVPTDGSLVTLAGELLRLGCDRLEWRRAPSVHVLRAAAPPYYSLLSATDEASGVRAYMPSPKGQDRVWLEVGCEHPLTRFLRPERGFALLVSHARGGAGEPAMFTSIPEGEYADIYTLVDLEVRGDEVARHHQADAEPPRLTVHLRLARAATSAAPSLWVIRSDAVTKIERLVASLPEESARSLLFSPCRPSDPEAELLVIVRLRPGPTQATFEIDGEPYRAHASIANLFLPCDATLEPPLRRDRIQELLTPDGDEVVWLRPTFNGGFQVERALEDAFHPLSEWVEYVIDTSAPTLVPWVKSCTFDFDAFVGVDAPAEARTEDATPEPRKRARREPDVPAARASRAVAPHQGPESAPARAVLSTASVALDVAAEELASTEKGLLALDAPPDDPARLALWGRMAALNAVLGRGHDAALCWARVAWESDDPAPIGRTWVAAETSSGRTAPETLVTIEDPSREQVRLLVAYLLEDSTRGTLRELSHDASLWLDRHDDGLDVRSAWLARVALSALVGGDRLALARARDRSLAKIHGGLSLERDVPSFLRRAGAVRDVAQVELLAGKLEALVGDYEKTKRKRSATEADPKLTGAYVRFVVAYGCARLGRVEQATALRDAAVRALPSSDLVHDVLSRAYAARIAHALEGLPAETPLPSDVSSSLSALAKLDRYKVDRVRQFSQVLEPHERLDPIMAFQRGEADPRGPEFAQLRGTSEPAGVQRAVATIMAKAKASAPEDRARLYDGVMDFFPMLPHDVAIGHLGLLLDDVADIAPARRVELLEEALMLAGHFGEEVLARRIFGILEPMVASVGPDGAAELAPLASGMLRTLRRFGLRDEAERLLGALQAAAKGTATVHLVARLHTASALAYLGESERARPVFEEALTALQGELPMPERLALTRALARALASAPIAYAIAGLEQIQRRLEVVTDSFNTNSHVCLSVVDFMESLVLGYVSEDLALDASARRLMDEDEYLVRRRIHRDLSR